MEENICKWWNWQGITLQNLQTAHESQQKKGKQPNQEMGRRPKKTFLQRRHIDVQ